MRRCPPSSQRYDQVILDLDGCVWVGDEPTPGAAEAIEALRAAGKGVAFVTNNSAPRRRGLRAQAVEHRHQGLARATW